MDQLDDGAASVYIGTDPDYQNAANDFDKPIVTPDEVKEFVANGTLEVIEVTEEDEFSEDTPTNVGILGGQDDVSLQDGEPVVAPTGDSDAPKVPDLGF